MQVRKQTWDLVRHLSGNASLYTWSYSGFLVSDTLGGIRLGLVERVLDRDWSRWPWDVATVSDQYFFIVTADRPGKLWMKCFCKACHMVL